ncbi:MAG: GAP family protein [Elainella sp.]
MNVFAELLPMIIGAMLAPVWIIIVLLILRSPDGLIKAMAFVAGITTVRLLQGLLFGYALAGAGAANDGSSLVVSVLLMVLGILLLISAVKKLMHEDDPDAPPPQWMHKLDRSAPVLFGLGMLFTLVAPKLWIFTLSAISVIRNAGLSAAESAIAFLLYVLGAQSLIILPLIVYAIAPRQSARGLAAASDWLTKHNRQITLTVSLVFGSFFLWKGISGLM